MNLTAYSNKVREIFDLAAELLPAERSAFLDQDCVDDKELREKVERLLQAKGGMGSFMETPVLARLEELLARELTGQRVGV